MFASVVGTFERIDTLAFDSNRDGDYEIYLLDLSTRVMHNMTHDPAQDRNPAWSADGRYIAFESVQRGVGNGIYVMDLYNLNREPRRVTPEFVRAVQPDWSPRGNYIAFSGAMDNMFNNEIFLVNLYDGQVVRVTNSPFAFDYGPRWNADGSQIAFGSYDQSLDTPADVFVVAFQEQTLQLAQARPQFLPVKISDDDSAADPSWTPDGRVLMRYEIAPFSLWVTEPFPDHEDEPLNDLRTVTEHPRMSPDGEWVAYGGAPNHQALWRELRLVRTDDSSEIVSLTRGAAEGGFWDNAPTWKPQ